ncbi:MAG TPA: sigma-54 dependent transcriptional regulator, partial [Candidatus Methylomirabilis sp.]|nr:sigma-54 dependent transcriptional regulator [Candidatus Methylomirabilis sp.]
MPPLVLVVEDEVILGDSISVYLERHDYVTSVARSGEEALRLAETTSPDVAVMDIRLPGMDGLEVLRRFRELSPGTEVVMMTAHASVASAVEAMRRGAFDYLTKPLDLDELLLAIEKALSHQRMRQEWSYLKARDETGGHLAEILGESPGMRTLRQQIARIAALDAPGSGDAPTVLILGETGVGKEMVARALHYTSPRASGPFVEINCAAIPTSLLEAELFGSEKGAYTDARAAKPGLFEAGDGGTVFLDEIGHMDHVLQVKLLKAIEEKAVRRVGGLRTKSFNARIVAATNRDLDAAIAGGTFRPDLYYRIKALTIEVPPLRERGKDTLLLAREFLERFTRQYGLPQATLAPEAEELVLEYPWPGNVRELAHVIERAVLLHGGPVLQPEDLGLAVEKAKALLVVKPGAPVQVDFSNGGIVLEDVERHLITEAL